MDTVSFTAMADGTKQEYEFLRSQELEVSIPDHVLDLLETVRGSSGGYQISRYDHALQTATRAHQAGESEQYVVAALLHDLGECIAPERHGEIAAAVLEGHVSEELVWIVKHHGLFQMYYYAHHFGGDRNARDQYRDHPYFDACVRFCDTYDQCSFDPDYKTLPVEFFAPMVRRVLGGRGASSVTSTAWELAELDGLGQAELVRRRQVSVAELVRAALQRLEDVNAALNAVVSPINDIDAQVAAVTSGGTRLPFGGVPTLLKDLGAEYRGSPQSDGSRFVRGFVGAEDSTIVSRMKAAGMVFVGRSGSSEFGAESETTLNGPTNNPWDLSRSTGGSSAGAAAAVASRLVPVAHASDTGGSIRGPAARCGLFGLKPTRGRNPLGPERSDTCAGLGVAHVLTWSVRDSAAVLDAISGPEPGSFSIPPPAPGSYLDAAGQDPPPLRIGVSLDSPDEQGVDEECRAAIERTAALCEQLGHRVEPAVPRYDGPGLVRAFDGVLCDLTAARAESWAAALGKPLRLDDLTPAVRLLVERGQRRTALEHYRSVTQLQRSAREVAAFFADYDAFLTPTTPTPAIPHPAPPDEHSVAEYWDGEVGKGTFMLLANVTGQPAMSVPLFLSSGGLPVGSQFLARFGREDTLLQLAGQLERSHPWREAWPRLGSDSH